ncbi:MAG: 30S ribosomal protein S3 [Candidatus Pacebacteria bacterium]|nr:30S ribosomal protein S3 [Candidatus Paceibacterota bacterium]
MSHTVHPYAHRLGIIRDWRSRWFGVNAQYREYLKEDMLLREWLEKKLRGSYVSDIEMERSAKALRIVLKTSRPGMIIGRSGEGAAKLRADIEKYLEKISANSAKIPGSLKKGAQEKKQELKLDIEEVKNPEASSAIVAQMVAEGLEKRMPFRRVMKQMVEKSMASREVQGIKILLSGRLGGADMSRKEELKKGRIPLQTLRADIDFKRYEAHLPYGNIGIKVWIYKGEIFEKDLK